MTTFPLPPPPPTLSYLFTSPCLFTTNTTLNDPPRWYSITILVIECLGMTAVLPYALMNVVHTHPSGSPGAARADARARSKTEAPCRCAARSASGARCRGEPPPRPLHPPPGLPADDGLSEPDKRFHVRVLVPW